MSDKSIMIELDKKIAIQSYVNIKTFIENVDNAFKKQTIRSILRRLPIMIKNNGLIGTLLFIKSKSKFDENENYDLIKNEYGYVEAWISEWLNEVFNIDRNMIIEKLINSDINEILMWTEEAIKVSTWYKKHAEEMLIDN